MYSKPIDSLIKLVDKSELYKIDYTILESIFLTEVLEEELTRYFKTTVEVDKIRVTRFGKMYVDYNHYNDGMLTYTYGTLMLE